YVNIVLLFGQSQISTYRAIHCYAKLTQPMHSGSRDALVVVAKQAIFARVGVDPQHTYTWLLGAHTTNGADTCLSSCLDQLGRDAAYRIDQAFVYGYVHHSQALRLEHEKNIAARRIGEVCHQPRVS